MTGLNLRVGLDDSVSFQLTDLVSVWALCWRKASLCARMACRLFLSISLAAAGTLAMRKASGNQMMLAVRVTAGTWQGRNTHTHLRNSAA